ncbi:LysR family transcriptional regulator [Pontixanthobacter aestiaquae]|uniref:LysR family transcriptional regulator n=1 Tax=Pontixanthobacter aestiaquae TaxID=1509367 RepID=A0A844Z942_9SPHN|nr:LysR family transcriptional regulator [Pontixanthobacter aestiaquae]MDN3644985.1 LysR family transcriptional regulator [Pontixanthobacter aestiaquae]MXO84014.1 LysR family transcriptional regulator [Pontixanthobacter aestiaquae]
MRVGEPTLDQLRIFLAVEEEGSFGGAARRMGRAVSAISYGVSQMEAQLGVTLFAREGSRKPQLTEAGKGLLAEARAVTGEVDALLAKTRSLHSGLESDVSLVLDVMVPGDVTAAVLRDFRAMFPTVALRLNVEALGAVAACLLSEEADLAIAGPVVGNHPELDRQSIGQVELVPVAAPDHPLAKAGIVPGESRKHLQLVLSDRSPLTEGREFSVLSPQSWRLADLGAKHSLLKEGIGWGNMPRPMVADDLKNGALVELDLPEKPGDAYTLSAMWRRDTKPGPATSWLINAIRDKLEGCDR